MSRRFQSTELIAAAIAWMAQRHNLAIKDIAAVYGIAPETARSILRRADPRHFTGQRYVPLLSLSELPPARRAWVNRHGLRWYSNRCDFLGCTKDQAIARITLQPCPLPNRDHERIASPFIARDDGSGRYHLLDRLSRTFVCQPHHEAVPFSVPRPRYRDFSPQHIPETLRCHPELAAWPPPDPLLHHRASKLVKIYTEITESQGPACGICHNRIATKIDHDHSTGLVRGALCDTCNRHVDECLHHSVCPHAKYLIAPRISRQVRHPNHKASSSRPIP